ncbi:MAG: multidrug efflux RND transporter permease subunit [Lacipirellulaceae bacterium]
MKLPHFFIDRPIFATVVSIVIVLVGSLAYFQLPVAQYPEVALPTVVVRTAYPGATPETIARTVATPLEQEINGVEDMLYMESQSTGDGSMQLTITFKLGSDLDKAQVLVQNRVAVAEPRLPEEVRRIGVTTTKSSPDLLLVVHLLSPDDSRDQLYISNYAYLQIRDRLARLDGVGDLQIFGGREYSMRIWLDMERIASLNLTAGDVVAALRSQNIQVAAGVIGQPPLENDGASQLMVSTKGRLRTPKEFEQIVVKSGENGRLVRVSDVARVELGARDYSVNSYLDGQPAVAMVVFQRPGSNGLETANNVIEAMEELSEDFPAGLGHEIVYNPTQFVSDSIDEVFVTLLQAGALVVLTVFIFLQNWRSTIIPVVAIPVSLIGTFALLLVMGFSLNMLSLFGLVLAIGIVVDDAIVVVENVERLMEDEGLDPRKATHQAMDEVSSALIATTLVLIAVFVPTAFISGISGQFYRQFAVTIAISTAISTLVSLTLSPALCALLLKPPGAKKNLLDKLSDKLLGWFFKTFNKVFDVINKIYGEFICKLLRVSFIALLVYGGLLVLTWFGFTRVPTGFIPPQDQGYLIVAIQLPDGASLSRTDEVTQKVKEIALETPGITHAVAFAGFSGATRTNNSNAAAVFTPLADYEDRESGMTIDTILNDLRGRLSKLQEAQIFVIAPPPVRGIGTGGGFKMQVEDRAGGTPRELQQAAFNLFMAANQEPGLVQVFSTFRADTPQIYADVDRTKVRMMDVPIGNVFDALQVYLGSTYVNDFNYLGRTYRVTAQAEPEFRDDPGDIAKLRTRSNSGAVVPLGSLVNIRTTTAPDRVVRYNLYPAADINGDTLPGTSSGDAIARMERLAEEILPPGYDFEWTDLAYQQKAAGNTAIFIFPLCVLFVFLALSAQYESWLLPLAVILIVPMCLLCAIAGVWFRGMDNNILTQIGFVVLVGLACKNAILIVEFAKAEEEKGKNRFEAAIEACRLRLRPILMTALSFVLGVIPLLIATGAGSEMRRALGTAVFSGMLGVTIFGLFFTPIFYVVLRKFAKDNPANTPDARC